ncbi:hypothetical protein HYC85_019864 [Camellia sinensis]|uniref:R13L1/DRL21-like LRR repeat region domain-containing protein n=1 Tax=Camellia sinensis TaxID=4442 RepID=A0A7J7GN68_CAMSI|nr:hypothetical protein HYC85_019864 [Camellia sinensis]
MCPNLIIADPDELCSLSSLQNLTIEGCPRLAGWWEESLFCLTSLPTFEIGYFSEELEHFPWPSTTVSAASEKESLKYLLDQLQHLLDQLQHLTTLRDLSLRFFYGLEALPEWLGNLSSLHSLKLYRCKIQMNLPTLEAMQCLTNLQSMKIYNCPLLNKRCARGSGQEWHKIAHIPFINNNGFQGLFYKEEFQIFFKCKCRIYCLPAALELQLSHQLDQLTLLERPSASELKKES